MMTSFSKITIELNAPDDMDDAALMDLSDQMDDIGFEEALEDLSLTLIRDHGLRLTVKVSS